ncbi:PREDICTED: cathepsin L1-like [Papilio xuthus]|uniref:Cathepsin L1-like n=1 Tax=Papilio xuthus TaxID=66420 RepID=A0AAJ7E7V3_PAPXU|nr:PREDICTED: cathepsin L1-like [Papilio xuthus]
MRVLVLLMCTLSLGYVLCLHLNADQWKTIKLLINKKGPSDNQRGIEVLLINTARSQNDYQRSINLANSLSNGKDTPNRIVYEIKRLIFHYNNTSDAKMRNHASVWTPKVQDYVPQSVDWRKRGAVSAVKWQGQCDSSYAFAAAGALEGLLYTLTGQFIPLSVQNLVDCSVDYHNHGCAGGTIEKALQYVAANEGINTERDYKYEARTKPCRFNRSALMLVSVGYSSLINGDELALKRVVAKQPVAARLRVCFYDFFFYKSGIYSDNCPEENRMTVSVLIVGYGIQGSEKYWLLKNSWGTQWGTAGYMRLARNKGNQCGIASAASYPYF